MKTNIYFWFYLAQLFLEWEIFQANVVEKIQTHILCSIIFFRKSYSLWDNVEKYCTAGQATVNIMGACAGYLGYTHTHTHTHTHAHPHTHTHPPTHTHTQTHTHTHPHTHTPLHTLILCNNYCFPLQQWLHERTSILRYTHFACLVNS